MSVQGLTIRDAAEADATAMGRLHVRAWQSAYRGVMPDEYLDGLCAEARITMWRSRISRADLPPLLVAVVADEVVGFAAFGAAQPSTSSPECGELYAMNLEPAHGHPRFCRGSRSRLRWRSPRPLSDLNS